MQRLDARAALIQGLLERIEGELAWFESVLDVRGGCLAGAVFGRADQTAASLLAPLARPPNCPVHALYAGVAYPPMVEEALSSWAGRPSLTWVRRVYTEHRQVDAKSTRVNRRFWAGAGQGHGPSPAVAEGDPASFPPQPVPPQLWSGDQL